jgi:sugar phosphate isomerase/epimerase
MALNRDSFDLDMACLHGPLEARLEAAEASGFSRVTLWARDLADHPQGYQAAVRLVRESRLQVSGLQMIRNYEGLSGPAHDYKLEVIKAMLEICVDIGAPRLLICASSTAPHSHDPAGVDADLRKLANLAVPAGVRIGFKAVPWGHMISDAQKAWELVYRVNHANLGLVLDSFHFIASGQHLDTLNEIPPEKIEFIQLADFSAPVVRERSDSRADHMRVFPGEGVLHEQVAAFVQRMDWLGYAGDYSFLVFNDDYRQLPAHIVARHGARAMAWVNNQVLRRRLPLNRLRTAV